MFLSTSVWKRAGSGLVLGIAGLMVFLDPADSPVPVAIALGGAFGPWRRAWRAAEGTSLRGALVWAALAVTLGLVAQVLALGEAVPSGRPWSGLMTYLMVLAILAGLISVLGARNPGGGAWAILMVLLVVVFLIPLLEGTGRLRRAQGPAQPHLDSPWTLFYGLLVLTGVTNFLPTRYGPAVSCLGAGLVLELLGLTRTGWPPRMHAMAWAGVAWTLAASAWLAGWCADRPSLGRTNLERLWFWFRDHWGVVWALRIQDRFNRTGALAHWPFVLTWFGLAPASQAPRGELGNLPGQAETTFRGLIRRFVVSERLDDLLDSRRMGPCPGKPRGR
jgi:hypothetical protein